MTTDIAVIRDTGEVVDLAGKIVATIDIDDPEAVYRAYRRVQEIEAQLAEARRTLTSALLRHAEVVGQRTVRLPSGARYERTGGPKTTYRDPAALRRALLQAGMPAHRVSEIVVETVDRKVAGAKANEAARGNPEYAAIIDQFRVKVDAPYGVTLK